MYCVVCYLFCNDFICVDMAEDVRYLILMEGVLMTTCCWTTASA
jgi:hypothetical protein